MLTVLVMGILVALCLELIGRQYRRLEWESLASVRAMAARHEVMFAEDRARHARLPVDSSALKQE